MGKIQKSGAKKHFYLISAAIGALYLVAIVKYPISNLFLENIISYILMPVVMIRLALGKMSIVVLIKNTMIFYAVIFIISGIGNALYYNTMIGYMFYKGDYSLLLIAIMAVCAYNVFGLFRHYMEVHKTYSGTQYTVSILVEDKWITTKGLYDTGNNLKDPIYNTCVSVVEKTLLYEKGIQPSELIKYKYHIIPYSSLGNNKGIIEVVEVKCMKVQNESIDLSLNNVMLGLYDGRLSGDDEYKVILNADIFEAGRINI